MGSATTTTTPADQVDDLIKAVADEAGLEISTQLASVPTGNSIGPCLNHILLYNNLVTASSISYIFIVFHCIRHDWRIYSAVCFCCG